MVPAAGASSMIRTVKILALDSPRDLDVVIDLLKCFPCVEKLYLVGFINLVTFLFNLCVINLIAKLYVCLFLSLV